MEINRITGASLGFGMTLLSASYNIFLTSVMTSMYNPQASGLSSDEPEKVDPKVNVELYEMRGDAKKKEEHNYPVVNPAALGFTTLPVSLVYCSNNTLHFFSQPILSVFPFWKAVKFYLSSEIQTWNWSRSPQLAWISVQLLFFSFLSPVSSPSSTTVHPVPTNEQPNPQARSLTNSPTTFPTTKLLINNSIPFSAVCLESEDEPFRSTNTSKQNVCTFASRPGTLTLTLRITLNLWLYTNNTDVSFLLLGSE